MLPPSKPANTRSSSRLSRGGSVETGSRAYRRSTGTPSQEKATSGTRADGTGIMLVTHSTRRSASTSSPKKWRRST